MGLLVRVKAIVKDGEVHALDEWLSARVHQYWREGMSGHVDDNNVEGGGGDNVGGLDMLCQR